MHKTARRFGKMFFSTYPFPSMPRILDVGSMVVDASNAESGSLRDFAPPGCCYVGADLASGTGVDVVLPAPGTLPFKDASFDVVVSTSCFEHDVAFWKTFQEMSRVTAPGGFIYINAPSNGVYHRYPLDCWRFYPDAALGLAAWANEQGVPVSLSESFVGDRDDDCWNDCVMIFVRAAGYEGSRLTDLLDRGIRNVQRPDLSPEPSRFSAFTEDESLLAAATEGAPLRQITAVAHGWIDCLNADLASGWVLSPDADCPAIVIAWLDGEIVGTAVAAGDRADLTAAGYPRSAFLIHFREPVDPEMVGDQLKIEALLSGASLGAIPITPAIEAALRSGPAISGVA